MEKKELDGERKEEAQTRAIEKLRSLLGMAPRALMYWQEGWSLLDKAGALGDTPILAAYRAAWKAIEAKYLRIPAEQLGRVNQVLPELTTLAKNYPQEPEIFFIRTAIISNLPPMFNFQVEATRDTRRLVALLERRWEELAPSLREAIVRFLHTSIYIEPADKKKIQGWLHRN